MDPNAGRDLRQLEKAQKSKRLRSSLFSFLKTDKVKGGMPPVRPRGERRNAAREAHELPAWRLPKNHVQDNTGTVFVPYPLRSVGGG